MNQEIEQKMKIKLENNPKTYITLKEIEEMLDAQIEYSQLVELIKQLIRDGLLKNVRKESEWKNSISFFEI